MDENLSIQELAIRIARHQRRLAWSAYICGMATATAVMLAILSFVKC
jgi:hypothetical protein